MLSRAYCPTPCCRPTPPPSDRYEAGCSVRYVPNTDYSGPDEFIYYWTYDKLQGQPPFDAAETNRVRQYIQVGHNATAKELPGTWVDLTPAAESACGDHQAAIDVGQTTTVTLTLENPRGDDIPRIYRATRFPPPPPAAGGARAGLTGEGFRRFCNRA
jgi:hypothetical protein